MRDSDTVNDARRAFLKTAAVAGGGAAVAAAGGAALAEAPEAAPADVAAPATGKRGYHVTPHVETYYRLARD
jgi:nitrous oxide reductase